MKKKVSEKTLTTKQAVTQMNHYWLDLSQLVSDKVKKKNMDDRFGIKDIKLDRGGNIISFNKYKRGLSDEVEIDEVYGTVKISGKRGRLVQHSPCEVVFVGNKKQAEKNLKQLKKDGGDGYIMQGVTIKVGEKVKGVGGCFSTFPPFCLNLCFASANLIKSFRDIASSISSNCPRLYLLNDIIFPPLSSLISLIPNLSSIFFFFTLSVDKWERSFQ